LPPALTFGEGREGGTMKLKCGCKVVPIPEPFGYTIEFCPLHEAAPTLKETNHILAVLSLQSDRYATDPEFRDAVDNALEANKLAEGI